MIKNYFITAWRNIIKNKVFSFINIFGLAIGITCCMLITAYLYQELTYDTYAREHSRIYRVGLRTINSGVTDEYPNVDNAVGPGIKNNIPGIEAYTRIMMSEPRYISYQDKLFKEQHLSLVDPNFLQLFSIPLIEGDARTALTQPSSIVLTAAMAKKYFGTTACVGKTLEEPGSPPFKVTGVIDKIPDNSHFHFDAFISRPVTPMYNKNWSNLGNFTYLLLDKNADARKVEAQFPNLVSKYVVPEIQHDMGVSLAEAQKSVNTFLFTLMPLTGIHLHSATKYEMEANGDSNYVYIFAALAIFILLLACINFTNLSTASSVNRSKEVGIRKVLGSLKGSLVSQFLTESVIITAFAMLFALGMVYLALPYFNDLAGRQLTFKLFVKPASVAVELVLVILVGIFAGIYPAFFLSSFKVISVLKGGATSNSPANKSLLRSGLVVFQFAISTSLIIATMVVYNQLSYMQNKKLGYDKDQVLILNDAFTLGHNLDAFKQQLLRDSRVVNVTIAGSIVGIGNVEGTQIYAKEFGDKDPRKEIHANIFRVEDSYMPTLGIQMAHGRNFTSSPADSSAVVINEAAVRELGWVKTDPIGKTIVRSGRRQFTVVGVVKDFHYASARLKIAPLMLLPGRSNLLMAIKVRSADMKDLLADVKTMWNNYRAAAPFSYIFLDEQYASLYASEQRTGKIFTSFALVAVIIASLGLFGLAAFMIRQRVKEIGIRKVLGASSVTITGMLSKEFLKLVAIAILISFPLTWLAMNRWLQDFAYRIDIPWWLFLLAGGLALLVAFATVSFQSVKAAIANPVKSLRSE